MTRVGDPDNEKQSNERVKHLPSSSPLGERKGQIHSLYEQPPHLNVKIPFMRKQTVDITAFYVFLARFRLRQFFLLLTHNVYFTTGYVLSCIGIYNYLRSHYKDQVISYGLRQQLPGVAEQIQTQNVSSFNFSTMPFAVEKAKTMGVARAAPPNKLARFAITPFVNRLDIYPNAVLIRFNSKWVDLLGNNLIRQWYVKPSLMAIEGHSPTIPQVQTISSLPKEEFQPSTNSHDKWGYIRPFMDLSDELPSQLEDLFSEPKRGTTRLFRGPIELLQPFTLPNSPACSTTETQFSPVPGTELHQWLRFSAIRTSPNYELLHVFPLGDVSTSDKVVEVSALQKGNQERRQEFVKRIKWQSLLDITARVKKTVFLRTIISPQYTTESLVKPDLRAMMAPLEDSFKQAAQAKILQERRLPRPKSLKAKLKRLRVARKVESQRVRGERKARNEVQKKYARLIKEYDTKLKERAKAKQHLQEADIQEQYGQTPLSATFYGQNTFDCVRSEATNLFFQLTRSELAELQAGPPSLEVPKPPRNPDDFLVQYLDFTFGAPEFKRKDFDRIRPPAIKNLLQAQIQLAGHGIKEVMAALSSRLTMSRGSKRAPVVGSYQATSGSAELRHRVKKETKQRTIDSTRQLPQKVEFEQKNTTGLQKHRDDVIATWPLKVRAYIRAVRAYRIGLHHYNQKYGAARSRYLDQLQTYNQLLRQAREIESLWDSTIPRFLAQQMKGLQSTSQPFIQSDGPMTPLKWDYASKFAYRLRKIPRAGSLNQALKIQKKSKLLSTRLKFVLELVSDQKNVRPPAFPAFHIPIPFTDIFPVDADLGRRHVLKNITFPPKMIHPDYGKYVNWKAIENAKKQADWYDNKLEQLPDLQEQYKMLAWFDDFYALLRKYGLSTNSADPGRYSISRPPTHLLGVISQDPEELGALIEENPLDVWVDGFLKGKHSFEKPIGFPLGCEYHWARTMQCYYHANYRTDPTFAYWRSRVQQKCVSTKRRDFLGFGNKVFGFSLGSTKTRLMTPKYAAAIWQKVNRETSEYIDKVNRLQVTKQDRQQFRAAFEYAQLLSDINIYRQLRTEVPSLIDSMLGVGYIREYAQALSQYIPRTRPVMNGFLFPDKTYEESQKSLQTAHRRYGILSMSPWAVFKTVVGRRPLEVLLPPGWRPFNEDIFSQDEEQNVIVPAHPVHRFARQPESIPTLETIQTLYGDLDISFLEEKPTPKAFLSPLRKTADKGQRAVYLYRRDHFKHLKQADGEVRTITLNKSPRFKGRFLQRLFQLPVKYLRFKRPLVRSEITGDITFHPGPVYYKEESVGSLLRGNLPTTKFMDVWVKQFLLSPWNIFKDRPTTFRGQQNRLLGEFGNRGLDEAELIRAQMGLKPSHNADYTALPTPNHSVQAQKNRIPLKSYGYRRNFFWSNNLEPLSPEEKGRFLARYGLHKTAVGPWTQDDSGKFFSSWLNWIYDARESDMLDTKPRRFIPRLTLDEWHQIVKRVLEAVRDTNDPDYTLQLPFFAYQSMVVNTPRKPQVELIAPKDRFAALTQMLIQVTGPTPGMYNEVGYSNIVNTLNYFDQQERFGLCSPFVSHLVIPRHELLPEPTGAPTLLAGSSKRVGTIAIPRWTHAERFIQSQLGTEPRDWVKTLAPVIRFLQKLPGGKRLMRERIYQKNYEPITPYWWCYIGEIIFLLWAARMFWYTCMESWEELLAILFDTFGGRRLRALFVELGLHNPFTYRVILESPGDFKANAASLNKRLFIQTCEIIGYLRNSCRPGPLLAPKGILFTGVPGTGKTFLVQMMAGEAGVPVVTQTASELFNRRNWSDLSAEQMYTPADQLAYAFDRARELSPCIFFIDEIDALGMSRASVMASTTENPRPDHDLYGYLRKPGTDQSRSFTPQITEQERSVRQIFAKNTVESLRKDDYKALTYGRYPGSDCLRTGLLFMYQDDARAFLKIQVGTLTEFLVQMDGLTRLNKVLVIGATNRMNVIDPALLRPGRLERVIRIYPPGARQRIAILRRECSKLGTTPNINWRYLANRTRGATIANLATAVNHSAVRAIVNESLHTIETLEYGLDTMTRHKLGHKMVSTLPLPTMSVRNTRDPFKFLRIAYYNAGKALLQNILPGHPSLPYAKLAVDPFDPDWTLEELFRSNMTRSQLDVLLIGLYAGKAAEFAMLYRDNPNEELATLLHLAESDQGAQEIAYGTELANALVDRWYLPEDKRMVSTMPVKDNETFRNISLAIDLEIRDSLEYWTDKHERLFAHLASDYDRPEVNENTKTCPPGHTIHQRHEELAFWALNISRLYMSAVSVSYSKWSKFNLREPWQSERSRFWVPPDLYYHQEPGSFDDFERFIKIVRSNEDQTTKTAAKQKQQYTKEWQTFSKQWDQQRFLDWTPEGEYYQLGGRQMLTFPDWHEVDRDYLLQRLVGRAFDAAYTILQDHMELLDRMATYLLKHRIIRQDKIEEMILEYTVDRYKAKLPLAIPFNNYFEPQSSYRILKVDIYGSEVPPLIGPLVYCRPQSEFIRTEQNGVLVYQRSWLADAPDKQIPLDVFAHDFDPYTPREARWFKKHQQKITPETMQ